MPMLLDPIMPMASVPSSDGWLYCSRKTLLLLSCHLDVTGVTAKWQEGDELLPVVALGVAGSFDGTGQSGHEVSWEYSPSNRKCCWTDEANARMVRAVLRKDNRT